MMIEATVALGRIARTPAVTTAAALAAVPVTAAGLQAVGLTTGHSTIDGLSDGLLDGRLWMVVGFAALFGAIGGVVAELLSLHGNIELPHRHDRAKPRRIRLEDPRNEIDLGIFARMLLGAAAGVSLLAIYSPENATMLIANALIAGSAATALLRLVRLRLLANAEPEKARSAKPEAPVPADGISAKAKLSVVGVQPPQAAAQ